MGDERRGTGAKPQEVCVGADRVFEQASEIDQLDSLGDGVFTRIVDRTLAPNDLCNGFFKVRLCPAPLPALTLP
jgi:hypothetical protein